MSDDGSKKDSIPNVSHMSEREYVVSRWDQLSKDTQVLLGGEDKGTILDLQYVFTNEYRRNRMIFLEANCEALVRNYLAAMNALKRVVSGEEASKLLLDELEKLPDEIEEIPDL